MKKCFYLGILVMGTQCFGVVEKDKIDDAIQESSLSRLKVYLGRADREEMGPEVRKKMYGRFLRAATEVTEEREKNLSVLNDSRDASRAALGAVAAYFSVLFFMDVRKNVTYFQQVNQNYQNVQQGTIVSMPMLISGMLSGSLASYLLYHGLTCSTQKGRIAEAKNIEKLIKSKINNGEESEQE